MVLLGLKTDLKDSNHDIVSYDEGKRLASDQGNISLYLNKIYSIDVTLGCVAFHEASSLNFQGVDETMDTVIRVGLSPPDQKRKRRFNLFGKRLEDRSLSLNKL